MNTDSHTFFTQNVWPQVADDLKASLRERYPNTRLGPEPDYTPLAEMPVCMVVGLTGTGKSTTLDQLAAMRDTNRVQYHDDIPTRRDLADLVIIPTAQVISGEPVRPVKDREARFGYTGKFAAEFDSGGSAAAYGWLHYRWDGHTPLLSDGLRGPGEIAHALAQYPRWHIIELWVDPVTRLGRLTNRNDSFDHVANTEADLDLSFLNADEQQRARHLLVQGEISAKAVITARAEAHNYGSDPYDRANTTANYHCLMIDGLNPARVARQVAEIVNGMMSPSHEEIEKLRQAIMRFRELLDIAQLRVQDSERAYERLFAGYTPEQIAAAKEKDLQWRLAETIVDDPSSLSKAVMQAQYDMRDMARALEELYNIITAE